MEYFKIVLSLPCSGLKVMTNSKTNFCLRPFVNPILSKQKKSLNFVTKFLHSYDFSPKVMTIFCLRPFVNPDPELDLCNVCVFFILDIKMNPKFLRYK